MLAGKKFSAPLGLLHPSSLVSAQQLHFQCSLPEMRAEDRSARMLAMVVNDEWEFLQQLSSSSAATITTTTQWECQIIANICFCISWSRWRGGRASNDILKQWRKTVINCSLKFKINKEQSSRHREREREGTLNWKWLVLAHFRELYGGKEVLEKKQKWGICYYFHKKLGIKIWITGP